MGTFTLHLGEKPEIVIDLACIVRGEYHSEVVRKQTQLILVLKGL